jgi:hypothetical protein
LSSTTAVVAANLTQLFTPDDRGYDKFNRSAIRFIPDFDFSKIRDDSCFIVQCYIAKIPAILIN